MGCCASNQVAPVDGETEQSDAIEKALRKDEQADKMVNKLLLLGTGESGKSTIFKQMLQLYGTGFSDTDRDSYIHIIRNNIITSMQDLVEAQPTFGGGEACSCPESVEVI